MLLQIIKNSLEPKIIQNLNYLSQITNLELYKTLNNSILDNEEGNETEQQTVNESLIEINDTNYINNESEINHNTTKLRNLATKDINFSYTYYSYYRLLDVSFLGLYVGLYQYLDIYPKTGLRQNYINIVIGSKKFTISTVNMHQYYNSGARYTTKKVVDTKFGLDKRFKPFGYLIKAELNLKSALYHGISIDVINGEMYTKGFTDFDLSVVGSFGPDFIFISFGVSVIGSIAKGNSYIQANTLLNNKSNLAKFIFYKNMNSCSVDIEFYFSVWLIVYEEKYSTTYNIFKGFSSYEYFYNYY